MYTNGNPLILRDEVNGADRRVLRAYLDGVGNLRIDGQDIGPATAMVSHDGEYEWFQRIDQADLPWLVEALGGVLGVDVMALLAAKYVGAGSYELERVIRESNLPVKRWEF